MTRALFASALLASFLAQVAWTGPIWADDWADLTAPVDDASTPGPDLYRNNRIDDGIDSMPNLVEPGPALAALVFVVAHAVARVAAVAAEEPGAHPCPLPSVARAPPAA